MPVIYATPRNIVATMPPESSGNVATMAEDNLHYERVKADMIHVCSSAENGCIDSNGNCKRGYKNRVPMEFSILDANGYPKYKRPTERDFKVVPHNRELLLDWEGHINVEYAGTSYTV